MKLFYTAVYTVVKCLVNVKEIYKRITCVIVQYSQMKTAIVSNGRYIRFRKQNIYVI